MEALCIMQMICYVNKHDKLVFAFFETVDRCLYTNTITVGETLLEKVSKEKCVCILCNRSTLMVCISLFFKFMQVLIDFATGMLDT